MIETSPRSAYWQGFRAGAPFILVIVPFGALFGVVAMEAGLNVVDTMSFSVLVIAGAAQFTALALMVDHAPTLIVLASALAVNLRMAMYSAALTPYLGQAKLWQRALIAYLLVDQSYATSHARFESDPPLTLPARLAFFFGSVTLVVPLWYLATLGGAVLGQQVPPALALDFAVPITFIALVMPMLRTLAHVAAALVGVLAALSLTWVPYNLGLLLAGTLGMIAGAQTELWLERRRS